jgi:hypothetical protein
MLRPFIQVWLQIFLLQAFHEAQLCLQSSLEDLLGYELQQEFLSQYLMHNLQSDNLRMLSYI